MCMCNIDWPELNKKEKKMVLENRSDHLEAL